MRDQVSTYIASSLYNKILEEKKTLKKVEEKKVKSRRRTITLIIASRSLARRLR